MTTFQCSSCGWTEKPCEHAHTPSSESILRIKYEAALLAIQRTIKKSSGGTVAEIARIAKEALG